MPNDYHNALFQPLDLGFTKFANRIIMGSMHTGLEEEKSFSSLAAFYQARAQSGVSAIVTGGFSPNVAGMLVPFAAKMANKKDQTKHHCITDAVHQYDTKIIMQILHAGRYAYHPFNVAPSAIKAPINMFKPWQLTKKGVYKTIDAYVNSAKLAKNAGYDGIEIMGSEGYLINQFIAKRTNHRCDEWGGDYENRIRFPLAIVNSIRASLGENFIIIFRLSMLDLVEEGSNWEEVVILAKSLETAGVNLINTGIGWHESRIPTIASMVPNSAFAFVTQQLKQAVNVPLVAANRITNPRQAGQIISSGMADMVSMARPFLADPNWVSKARHGQDELINTCIACNQACLDNVFKRKKASCLVNPYACREEELIITQVAQPKRLAVVGGGLAGLSFAKTAAERGHKVTLFEKNACLGGQFNLAKQIPGKADYQATIDYFTKQLSNLEVTVHLNMQATKEILENFDEIIIATGIKPRIPNILGINHQSVMTYIDAINGTRAVGEIVAIIGGGGIGIDTATKLLGAQENYYHEWGVDTSFMTRGGLSNKEPAHPIRTLYILQRKKTAIGANLGKTTGWIHRLNLKKNGVKALNGVNYVKIDDAGLHYIQHRKQHCLPVDSIIICAGQEEELTLYNELKSSGLQVHVLGGAYQARELDAKQAIEQATRLALVV